MYCRELSFDGPAPSERHSITNNARHQTKLSLLSAWHSLKRVLYTVVFYPSNLQYWRMAKPSPKHAGDQILVTLGIAIRAIRTDQGVSQEALANSAILDRSYMGGIERGEHNLTVMNLVKIADQLGVKPSEIFRKAGL